MPQPCRQLRHEHDEFGVPLAGTGKNSNPFGFTGYQADEVAGLYYAQARYYDAGLGRFGAVDIHWNADNCIYGDMPKRSFTANVFVIMQSSNLYGYCINNPAIFFDPMGELVWLGEIHNAVQKMKRWFV